MKAFPFYKQHDQMDCGPTCLRMLAKYYGRNYSIQRLREYSNINKIGVSLLGVSEAAEKIGFRTLGAKVNIEQLNTAVLPCILHWQQRHFVILYKKKKGKYHIADPALGVIKFTAQEFVDSWFGKTQQNSGIALFISPTPQFYEGEDDKKTGLNWTVLFNYRRAYTRLIIQLFFGLAIGSILQLIAPLLTQQIVDTGINTRNLSFVNIILIAQIMLFLGTMSVGFIRSWIMLHMTTRINISILTNFLAKLMRLPMGFFESKRTGDIMQRMNDHKRIESFLTGTTLNTLFSLLNLALYIVVVAFYNTQILLIFLVSTILYTSAILIFMKRRRELDQRQFTNSANNQSNMVELITGIQEIKLHNCEQQKRWHWESIQARLFRYSVKSLALSQYQQAGSSFINQGKNILITFISAKAVIEGNLTLGGMMAVQYMASQLNSPIEQLLGLMQGYQDAKISLERLNEVHGLDDEESVDKHWVYDLPSNKSISISNLTFRYPGAGNDPILENVNLQVPEGKTTAIVGMSGSGKTTILKLLLRFYQAEKGEIKVGDTNLNQISFKEWRKTCGVVMQDGFIFSDTIAGNIAVGDDHPNPEQIERAIKVANIQEFIEALPLGLNTKIGSGGNGISQGQRQRLLIARAVYKDPHYIFFDEATNSLDANNEKVIMDNLKDFFTGRTVIVVAHRLSTVRNADNIIVLSKGRIIEQGTHMELNNIKGEYHGLVKNQLELGS
ncbi:peptidase domain-containing ABC transporter [Mucilaginibacter paludis]|uniref:ABC transporter related protein n=1 Tax=Mucilaginibacter paludis DSM 18603 TaxID=714943 RepID=H1YIG2_9SPHI|nr:peptidase domain-containing ABC transporter [Mucilaginibacter paludis]EHQ27575.1 ABC transporter related protein [Mucilaginibacter paludis DSM 18603]